jgi:K+-transporting ATPase ATPase C chain
MKILWQSLRLYLAITLLTGVVYPFVVTGLAQLSFPKQANGSPVVENGRLVGSTLLAQKFASPRYFWPRPSASDFATIPSGASNQGPTSAALKKSIAERRAKFGKDAPIDLLTASGSGLDPDISPPAAELQIARVAAARRLDPAQVADLVSQSIEGPQLGFLGAPRINVLRLNLALDHTGD